jgi:hypothetical protein
VALQLRQGVVSDGVRGGEQTEFVADVGQEGRNGVVQLEVDFDVELGVGG